MVFSIALVQSTKEVAVFDLYFIFSFPIVIRPFCGGKLVVDVTFIVVAVSFISAVVLVVEFPLDGSG